MPEILDDAAIHAALERWAAPAEDAEWVTLGEAEDAAGVSRSAIRQWFRNGDVPSVIVEGPHGQQRLVDLEATIARAQMAGNRVGRRRRGDRVEELEERVAELEARLADVERRLDRDA